VDLEHAVGVLLEEGPKPLAELGLVERESREVPALQEQDRLVLVRPGDQRDGRRDLRCGGIVEVRGDDAAVHHRPQHAARTRELLLDGTEPFRRDHEQVARLLLREAERVDHLVRRLRRRLARHEAEARQALDAGAVEQALRARPRGERSAPYVVFTTTLWPSPAAGAASGGRSCPA
jgi:hypothetical protein